MVVVKYMRKLLSTIHILNRMTVLLLSFGLCAYHGMAQVSLSERLTHVLKTQDMENGLKLYNEITDSDIKQLPDSTLFDYHYLGGWLNHEKSNHPKAISHLLEAKRLCDTSQGTHFGAYMEIMDVLGDEYLELGQYENALGIYQEGIVKSTYMRTVDSQEFGLLIMGVQECYERLGWYNEIPTHLMDAWSFWNKDEKPLVTYTYYPLWCLHQFYRRYEMYDKAIQVSDMIIKFISEKGGLYHPEMANELYFRGNTLKDMGRNSEAIDIYRQGLSVLRFNHLDTCETYKTISDNLLMVLVSENRVEESHSVLNELNDYSKRTNNPKIYKNALYSAVKRYNDIGNYTQALLLNKELVSLNFSEEERAVIEKQTKTIEYNNDITIALPQLEKQFNTLSQGSDDWFDIGHKLSSAYYLSKRLDDDINVLKVLYKGCLAKSDTSSDYFFWVINNLYGSCMDTNRFEDALKYAIEKLKCLSSIPDVPEDLVYYAGNNVIAAKLRSKTLNDIDVDLENAESLCSKIFGKESILYAVYLHNKGRAYQLQGKFNEAKQWYLKSIALHTKIKGSPMNRTVKFLMETENQITDAELDF